MTTQTVNPSLVSTADAHPTAQSEYKAQSQYKSKGRTLNSSKLNNDLANVSCNQQDKFATHKPVKDKNRRLNIVFILTDQERYLDDDLLPKGFKLPGRERLKKRGVNFTNHHIASAVCTSSRSVIYTGLHMPNTQLFDNLDFPWAIDLDKNIGTLGQLVGEAGYYAAYKGKWHLSDLGDLGEQALPDADLTKIIESYGFHDYVGIGDVIGMVQGGWINDELITAQATRWLRVRGNPMTANDEPWLLAVNLVNPHDVMFYNTDLPDEHIQNKPPPLIGLSREPNTPFYQRQWDFKLPESRNEPFDKKGRPPAHLDYQLSRDTQVGAFPNEDGRWQRLLNYYYNCILATDNMVVNILDEIDALGLTDNTIIVLTSDHGELAGSHGNHGKGATVYHEQNHVPLIISHPDYPETYGQDCHALTSHLDIATTIMAWTHHRETKKQSPEADTDTSALDNTFENDQVYLKPNRYTQKNKRQGKDLTPLLKKGEQAEVNEIREGVLFCFNMFAYLDGNFLTGVQRQLNSKDSGNKDINNNDKANLDKQNLSIDFSKRGAIRSVFDGRYKYSRYFSPKQHNQPTTMAQIFALNDVELFDLKTDPNEMNNLAVDSQQNQALILQMNAKLNKLIDDEINGVDDGAYLPFADAKWW